MLYCHRDCGLFPGIIKWEFLIQKEELENFMEVGEVKISVIIAAYNAEDFIEETLDSVLHQIMDDYEVIVIDDGSTDRTPEILEQYAQLYDSLHIMKQDNKGPSAARNAGLTIAKGKYLYFLDADDVLELDSLDSLYKCAEKRNADLVIAKYDMFDQSRIYPVYSIDQLVKKRKIKKYDQQIWWTFALWNKLFRREIIKRNSLKFPPVSYSEDGVFVMQYIYCSKKITGLNKVVIHYRRLYNLNASSVTASVSQSKICDYVQAHQLIYQFAKKSLLKDYPGYSSITELEAGNQDVHLYLDEFRRKKTQILIDQFYTKFWQLDENTVCLLVKEIANGFLDLDLRSRSMLQDTHPELSLSHLPVEAREMMAQAYFTVVLYGCEECKENFMNSLSSLLVQNLLPIIILLPLSMKKFVEESELAQGNIQYIDVCSEKELFYHAIQSVNTPYITFADPRITYTNNAFKIAFKLFVKSPGDFLIELIYHRNYGDMSAILLNRKAMDSLKFGYEANPYLCMDNTLANKFFRVEFLREKQFNKEKTLLEYLPECYQRGYYPFFNDKTVIYEGKEEEFIDFVSTSKTKSLICDYLEEKEVDLTSPEIKRNLKEVFTKLLKFPEKYPWQLIFKKMVAFIKKFKVKDKVLFVTIRKDKELEEGNLKILYPHIKGKKVICAKMLPHGWLTELKFYYQIFTSKVIVTDDYLRYLRYFHIRENQRVIQLWHACGAFKKFGQHGTNLSTYTDNATHVQYNLVTVSGAGVRPIYAEAFNIDINKVVALGCPRTDLFYDQNRILKITEKIYGKYPEWRDKEIVIYAPTFRDINGERSEFHPDLDFQKLSKELRSDQIFLICPHPLMKNSIVDGEYQNVKVIREFSTMELMFVSDMLITDYSSVIFEYALLKRPIAFFCYDLANYNRGFYLDYPDDLPGDIYQTQEELINYICSKEKHILSDKFNWFVEKYMSACDGHSTERIAAMINDYMIMEEKDDK